MGIRTKEPADYLRYVLNETGYMSALKDRNAPEDVRGLKTWKSWCARWPRRMDAGESFTEFSGCGGAGERRGSFEGAGVTLITLHSTKGWSLTTCF